MHGNDYRTALPRPNELRVLRELQETGGWWKANELTQYSGVKLTHVYTYLMRMSKRGYVRGDGPARDRWYRITPLGRKAVRLVEQVERLGAR